MSKYKKKTSYLESLTIDPNTGEILKDYKQLVRDKIPIKSNYIKVFPRFNSSNLNLKYEGFLQQMIEHFLQYETNELRIKNKPSRKVKHNNFYNTIGVTSRSFTCIMKYFRDNHYIIKHNGRYYLNPKVAIKGKSVDIKTVLLFYQNDSELRKLISKRSKHDIDIYNKLNK
tara:strand:+ start:160 stop:672 length:513 start_codon:yes stop_codon:yes gene_type:complete